MDYNTIHNPSSSSTPKLIPSYINNSRRPINAKNDKNNSNNNIKGGNKNSSCINKKVVKLSTDPQSVAARERRHRISDRFKILQSLVPGGDKLDTVSLLDHAIQYVKFLKAQIWLHEVIINNNNEDKGNYISQDYWYDQSLINVNNINSHSSVIQGEQYCYDALMCNSDINNVGQGQQEGGCYGGNGGDSGCCNPNQEICMAVPKEEPVYDNWCYKGDDNQNVYQIRPCNYY